MQRPPTVLPTVPAVEYRLADAPVDMLGVHHRSRPDLFPPPWPTITTMGADTGVEFADCSHRAGRYYLEGMSPSERDHLWLEMFVACRQDAAQGLPTLPLNLRPLGLYVPVLDFDGATVSQTRMKQIAFVYHTVLQHFNCDRSVLVATNDKGNYHVHLPGFLAVSPSQVSLVHRLACCIDRSLPSTVRGDFDNGPLAGHIRMHGSGKYDSSGHYDPRSVYRFFCAIDGDGDWLREEQVDPRWYANWPNAEQVLAFMQHPAMAMPCVTTTYAAARLRHPNEAGGDWRKRDITDACFAAPGAVGVMQTRSMLMIDGRGCTLWRQDDEHDGHATRVLLRVVTEGYKRCAYSWLMCIDCGCNDVVAGKCVQLESTQFNYMHIDDVLCLPRVVLDPKPLPIHGSRLLDVPLEHLIEPGGFRIIGADGQQDLDGERRVQPTELSVVDIAAFMAKHAGRPLSAIELEGVKFEPHVLDPASIISRRTGKPYMLLGLAATQRHPGGNCLQIVQLQAPPDTGKTQAALRMALRLQQKLLIITPLESLARSWDTKVRRKAQTFAADEMEMHRVEGTTPITLIPRPLTFAYYKDASVPEQRRADVVTLCANSVPPLVFDGLDPEPKYDPKIVVIDEVRTVAQYLFTAATFDRTRLKAVHGLLSVMARARLVIVLDKDIGPLVNMFLGLAVAFRANQAGAARIMDPVLIQRYVVPDSRRFRLTTFPPDHVVPLIREKVQDGRVIVFEPRLDQVGRYAKELAHNDDDEELEAEEGATTIDADRIMTVTGETCPDEKRTFAEGPLEILLARHTEVLFHTSAAGIGVSIDGEEYFRYIIGVQQSFLGCREMVQGMMRARDQAGAVDNVRHMYLAIKPNTPTHALWGMPTIGTELWGLVAKCGEGAFRGTATYDLAALYRRDGFGRYIIDWTDVLVLMTVAIAGSLDLSTRTQWQQWELWAQRNNAPIDHLDTPAKRSKNDLKRSRAALAESQAERIDALPVRESDSNLTKAHKLKLLAGLGIKSDSPLKECGPLMHWAANQNVQSHMWNLAALLAPSLAVVRRLEQQRMAAMKHNGGGHAPDDGNLVTEWCLVRAADCVFGNRLGTEIDEQIGVGVHSAFDPSRIVSLDDFFKEMRDWGMVGGTKSAILGYAASKRYRNARGRNGMLEDAAIVLRHDTPEELIELRSKARAMWAKAVLSAALGSGLLTRYTRNVDLSVRQQRLSLVPSWASVAGLDVTLLRLPPGLPSPEVAWGAEE